MRGLVEDQERIRGGFIFSKVTLQKNGHRFAGFIFDLDHAPDLSFHLSLGFQKNHLKSASLMGFASVRFTFGPGIEGN